MATLRATGASTLKAGLRTWAEPFCSVLPSADRDIVEVHACLRGQLAVISSNQSNYLASMP